uniref:PB1-like domain-containing protein n=1 Tax=Lactuca sativa TaxID=4236 RepID=A0A9R1UVQ1_LACSA|nr:hypothetical protein LSAT_V11C800453920 [Lactuca sativa]
MVRYVKQRQTYVDLCNIDTFSIHDINGIILELGYVENGTPQYYYFSRPLYDLDFGLFALGGDQDIHHFGSYVSKNKLIEVHIEHGNSSFLTYEMPTNHSKVRIQEIIQPPTCSRRLFLGWKGDDIWEKNMNKVDVVGHSIWEDNMNKGSHVDSVRDYDARDNNEGSDSDDNDYLVDEDNMVENVDIDVLNFYLNIDKDVGWLGMRNNKRNVRIIESWVPPIYWLKMWKDMYFFIIDPINGSTCGKYSSALQLYFLLNTMSPSGDYRRNRRNQLWK